ncbi:hypothetical protein B0T20DRAFT_373193 [Sordaria brevicollis]|uniref:Protein kinase domain-containing protein n=1 Tax=Sordaria brevicollis TaxID=83679 RepID=A0AAE0PI84_SORBR|nr:hypothetical protein B0T20DRAFT_373193 [Sordaria brevicollis]
MGSAGYPIISITQPASNDSILESRTEDMPASPIIPASHSSYSCLNSDISEYDEWASPSPSDIDSSAKERSQNEHQLSNDWRNDFNHERRPEIEESFEELAAPISREPSEISDLGQRLYYESRTTDNRAPSASVSGESHTLARPSGRKSLQDRLFEALQRKNRTTPLAQGFFPTTALSTIITVRTVKKELQEQRSLKNYNRDRISQFAQMICTETPCKTSNSNENGDVISFRKIFAILVMLDQVPAIVRFLKTNVNDLDLPLEAMYRSHGGLYDLRRRKAPSERLKCFPKHWGSLLLSRFEEMQWATLAPWFGKARASSETGVLHYRLHDKTVLPFLGDCDEGPEEENEFAGGGGRVFKAKIHPGHHTFHNKQGDRYGHHGDIKPENILWFPDRDGSPVGPSAFEGGTLKLTDFGLADISTKRTMSRIRGTAIMVTRCYCAPEIDLPDGGGHGRQYDMWTLGCLYIEFVTWLIGGWQLLSKFNLARIALDKEWCSFKTDTFFMIQENSDSPDKEKEAIVKPQVTKFIEQLHGHPKCTQFLHDLLDMVQTGLLIVKKSNGQHLERLSSHQVCGRLNDMWRRCLESDTYGSKPCPRRGSNAI